MMTKIAVAEVQPLAIVAARLVIAAGFLAIVALAAKVAWPKGSIWWPILLTAIFGNTLPFFLITWGQEVVDAGLAAIFMAIMPLCTILIAHLVTDDEKLGFWVVAGFLIALTGVVCAFWHRQAGAIRRHVAAPICAPRRCDVLRYQCRHHEAADRFTVAKHGGCTGCSCRRCDITLRRARRSAGSSGLVMFRRAPPLSIVYTGIMPTAVGAIMLLLIVKRAGASFLSQINFMVPLFGVGFAMLFLGERLPANAALALALILCGVALSRRHPRPATRPVNKAV